MRVLIIGGTGTISSGLVEESVKRGYDTFAIQKPSELGHAAEFLLDLCC